LEIIHAVAPIEDSALNVSSQSFAGEFVNNETQGLLTGGIENTLEGQQFNLASITAQSLGTAAGQNLGDRIGAGIQSAQLREKYNTANTYMQALGGSASADTSTSTASQFGQNSAKTRLGMFSGSSSNSKIQSKQNSQNSNESINKNYQNTNSTTAPKWGDLLTSIGTTMDDPTLALIGATNPDSQSPLSNYVLTGAENLVASQHASSDKLLLPSEKENAWIENSHLLLGSAATVAGYGEYSNVVGDMWKGANNKWYPKSFGGNGTTGARRIPLKKAEMWHTGAKYAFWADILISTGEGVMNLLSLPQPNYKAAGLNGIDILMAGIGYRGGRGGFLASTAYFAGKAVVDNLDIIDEAMQDANEASEINKEITGTGTWEKLKF
jgi:hypothetical protein